MRALRKVLSVLLLLLIIPVLIGQIALHSVRSLLVDPAFPKQVMREAGVYAAMEEALLQAVQAEINPEQFGIALPRERVSRIINRVLPPAALAEISNQVVDGLYAWAWGSSPVPVLLIDLTGIRRQLLPVVRDELQAMMDALPVCTREQLLQLSRNPPTGIPPCKTPDKQTNDAALESALRSLSLERLIPAQIDLAAVFAEREGPGYWENAWHEVQQVRAVLDLIIWGWAIVTLLLLLLALLNLDTWHTPFGWAGTAGILAGGPMVLLGLAGHGLLQAAAGTWMADTGTPIAATAVAIGLQALVGAIQGISFTVLLAGLGAVAVAVYGKMSAQPPEGARL